MTVFRLSPPPMFDLVEARNFDGGWFGSWEQSNRLSWGQAAAIHASIREVLG